MMLHLLHKQEAEKYLNFEVESNFIITCCLLIYGFYLYLSGDAKERQKWIDKLRACSGSNAADVVSINWFLLYCITTINFSWYF
jgi:hypothetical protein